MKKFFTLLSAIAVMGVNAQTQTLSQTSDDVYVESVSASACLDNSNGYFRLFDLNDYGITGSFNITSVDGAAVIWDGGFGEVTVWTLDGEETEHIDNTLFTDTGLYGAYVNSSGTRVWDWINFEIYDELPQPLTNDKKFAVVVTHDVTNSDAGWLGSLWPLYTEGDETKSAYFGGPTTGCYADTEGFATRFSSFVTGGKRAILLTVTGEVEGMGTVELGGRYLSVYPNPATDVLNVNLDGRVAQSVEIVNMAGQSLYSAKASNKVNVNFLPSGVYVLRVKDDKGVTHMSKFVKK